MKKITALTLLLTPLAALAQDKLVKKKISLNLTEEYHVSTTNKDQREGLYMVTDPNGSAVVRGKYDNGKKVGTWFFYNPDNKLSQQYDYNTGKLLYTDQDSGSYVKVDYSIAAPENAQVQPPVKIGGATLAFLTFFNSKDIPATILKEKTDVNVKYTISVDEAGHIADAWADYESAGTTERKRLSVRPNSSGLLDFIPAQINGKPVKSTVTMATTLPMDVNKQNSYNMMMSNQKQ
ncbi:hypothetical protein DYU05_12105 [Mucilaginibacter terrenus]|uniref:DUF4595 domain-containing protein n=1 Tax=Mucilaginibacter terrenus TaxID=2482727 RepID=A0A3E2NPF8_9SPHI|nr:hypothetical protein [Mucilaginibacter terrenus]RFZ82896.1 hypothetical protein DYU05_12105 [Mucilaginibacter terrenus]